MANTKISELVTADTLIGNTLFVIVDRSTGTPITKKVELSVLDAHLDITVDKANGAYTHANSAYASQNVTGTYANNAYTHANSGFIQANAAFNFANTANNHANQAFHQANSAYASQNVTGTYANGAYTHANAGFIHANSGFNFANTANNHANQAYTHANSGFIQANAVYTLANINFTSAETRLNVSNTVTGYRFDQYTGDNPIIYTNPGKTISLDLLHIPHQSIAIRDAVNGINVTSGLLHVSPTGVQTLNDEAQGKNSGVLFWKVPSSEVNKDYVYQSLTNPTIHGTIRIEQRPTVIQERANLNSSRTNAAFLLANTTSVAVDSLSVNVAAAFEQANASYNVANSGIVYTSPNPSIWNTSAPTDVANAISRLANAIYALQSNTPIL
jgi:hypothetical protein